MKQILLILLIVFGIVFSSYSQDWHWARNLPTKDVEVDNNDNIYVLGSFSNSLSIGDTTLVSKGSLDVFVAKYKPDGGLLWAKSFGGTNTEFPEDLAINPITGGVVISGTFEENLKIDFYNFTSRGQTDVFLVNIDPTGRVLWPQQIGGPGLDYANGIALNNVGDIFVTGSFNSYNGNTLWGSISKQGIGFHDMFLTKITPNGQFQWVRNAGSPGFTQTSGLDIAIDSNGNVYITGIYSFNTTFDHLVLNSDGVFGFVAKYDTNGLISWVKGVADKPAGSPYSQSFSNGIAVDSDDNLVVTGNFEGAAQFGSTIINRPNNNADAFVSKLNPSGSVIWVKTGASDAYLKCFGKKVKVDRSGNYWVIGEYGGNTDFGSSTLAGFGGLDIFVSKYKKDGTLLFLKGVGSPDGSERAENIALSSQGEAFITGTAGGIMELSPTFIKSGNFYAKLSGLQPCTIAIPNAGTDITICSFETTNIGQSPGNGLTYEWFPTTGLSNPNIANPTFTWSFNNTSQAKLVYYLTVTSPTGCTASDKVEITVNPKPVADAGTDKEICSGSTIQIGKSAVSGTTYQWSVTPSLPNFSSTIANPAISFPIVTTETVYTFKIKATKGTCISEDEVLVKVSPIPTSSANAVNRCGPGTVNILASGALAGGTYKWYTTSTGGSAIPNETGSSFTTPSLAATTTYFVSVASGNCESPRTAVTATINPVPTAPSVTAAVSYCPGETAATLTATGINLKWYTVATGGTASNTAPTPSTSISRVTNYYVSQTVNGCESDRAQIAVTVTESLGSNTISGTQTLCSGSTTLPITGSTPTGGNGAYVYQWESSTTNSNLGFAPAQGNYTGKDYTPGVLTQITYFRRKVSSGNCSSTSTPVTITVIPPITNNSVSGNQQVCAGSIPGTLTGSIPSGGNGQISYLWESSTINATSGFSAAAGLNNAQSYNPGTLNATTYLRRIVTSSPCTSVSNVIEVTVNIMPLAPTVSPVDLCQGGNAIALTATGSNLKWYTAATGGTALTSAPVPTTTTLGTTTYYVSQTINNCESAREAIVVTINANPTATFTAFSNNTICSAVTNFALTGGQPASGTYSGSGVSNGIFNASVAGPGTHTMTYTVTQNGCSTSATQPIHVTTCTGVKDAELQAKLLVYPNPTYGEIKVSLPLAGKTGVTVRILDMKGRVVLERSYLKQASELKATYNVSQEAKGLYLLLIITDSGVVSKKIALQ